MQTMNQLKVKFKFAVTSTIMYQRSVVVTLEMKGSSLVETLTAALASRLRQIVNISSWIEAKSKTEQQWCSCWFRLLSFTVHESDVFIVSALCRFSRFKPRKLRICRFCWQTAVMLKGNDLDISLFLSFIYLFP